jgi:hypothetical protein
MNKKVFLGLLIGIPVFLGIIGASQPPHTSVKSAATSRNAQLTISPEKNPTITIAKPTLTPTNTPVPTKYIAPTQYIQPTTPPFTDNSSGLSNDNYYTNSDGNEVHSPADSTNGSIPAGATAKCNDGTYSFSQHHSGTCSGHAGVAQWL